jgi:DNA-3-methyladenine glycosylase II
VQLHRNHQFDLTLPQPFDFSRTVAKPAGWHWSTIEETFKDGVLWSGVYIGEKPVGVKISAQGNEVQVVIYTSSPLLSAELSLLHSILWNGLGGEEDLNGFYEFAKSEEILSTTVKDLYGMRLGTLDDVFGRTILAILLQMAPMTRSDTMMTALLEHYGNRIEFDGKKVILWPRPSDIAAVDPEDLKKKANVGYRAKRLVKAAQFLSAHPLSTREMASLPEEEAIRKLAEIPGVGEYSAGIIFGRSSLPLDVWSVVIMSELFLGHTPQDPRAEIDAVIATLTRRWGKWKWFAFVYVVNDLEQLAETYHLSRIH